MMFAATAIPLPPSRSLAKVSATEASTLPRIAIEAPSPAVDGGRFPARRTVGSVVTVECDLICDGHDRLAATLKYRGPGETAWTEVPMRLVVNDRWAADLPLDRLGLTHYTIEAWKDVWAYYVFELSAKHRAGVNTTLEIKEGVALVEAAAGRTKSRKLANALKAVLKGRKNDDALRDVLLHPDTAALMHAADDRPFRVELERPIPLQAERTAAGFASWYEVFPRSMSDDPKLHGTFRDVIRHLPRIKRMGFDVLYFPPIHPIGTKNRKGQNNTLTPGPEDVGSPYAIGSADGGHTETHPELGQYRGFRASADGGGPGGNRAGIGFRDPMLAGPSMAEATSGLVQLAARRHDPLRREPAKEIRGHRQRRFLCAGSSAGSCGSHCVTRCCSGRGRACGLFRVDNPHTKAFPVLGVDDRGGAAALSRHRVPRRGVH